MDAPQGLAPDAGSFSLGAFAAEFTRPQRVVQLQTMGADAPWRTLSSAVEVRQPVMTTYASQSTYDSLSICL